MPLLNQYLEVFFLLGNGWINSLLGTIAKIAIVGLNT